MVETRASFTKFVRWIPLLLSLDGSGSRAISGDRFLPFLVERGEGTDTFVNFCPAFRGRGESRELFLCLLLLHCLQLKIIFMPTWHATLHHSLG